jgi:hypothetical protein
LAINYQVKLDQWLHKGLGMTSMSKRDFLELFRLAWHKAFSVANVQGGFAKTGIWPFLPSIVLSAITSRPETPPDT